MERCSDGVEDQGAEAALWGRRRRQESTEPVLERAVSRERLFLSARKLRRSCSGFWLSSGCSRTWPASAAARSITCALSLARCAAGGDPANTNPIGISAAFQSSSLKIKCGVSNQLNPVQMGGSPRVAPRLPRLPAWCPPPPKGASSMASSLCLLTSPSEMLTSPSEILTVSHQRDVNVHPARC